MWDPGRQQVYAIHEKVSRLWWGALSTDSPFLAWRKGEGQWLGLLHKHGDYSLSVQLCGRWWSHSPRESLPRQEAGKVPVARGEYREDPEWHVEGVFTKALGQGCHCNHEILHSRWLFHSGAELPHRLSQPQVQGETNEYSGLSVSIGGKVYHRLLPGKVLKPLHQSLLKIIFIHALVKGSQLGIKTEVACGISAGSGGTLRMADSKLI